MDSLTSSRRSEKALLCWFAAPIRCGVDAITFESNQYARLVARYEAFYSRCKDLLSRKNKIGESDFREVCTMLHDFVRASSSYCANPYSRKPERERRDETWAVIEKGMMYVLALKERSVLSDPRLIAVGTKRCQFPLKGVES